MRTREGITFHLIEWHPFLAHKLPPHYLRQFATLLAKYARQTKQEIAAEERQAEARHERQQAAMDQQWTDRGKTPEVRQIQRNLKWLVDGMPRGATIPVNVDLRSPAGAKEEGCAISATSPT